ncbi:putative NADH:ubiquinone oxidoreductase, subunit RnfC [Methanomethylovorans hollandica DSM 15978]|uniref:Putative NADH:ubiquinone oxidoreductase, subunit RnfC n=1 Tax=Methanomethylovorans hollandica (strain DSM 15978 / NBRC 107637 / DMS1) TaxID=867904 RepID=L0KU88_METHD|nr:Rnf electron transport complex subunit RnfC [Methanomethylovorans hollandica]AGB48681.1 putative NADH:ubiquinone oxidoreductase, subunit RnfC [Methanomethylovorans hollandica DSM 15978]
MESKRLSKLPEKVIIPLKQHKGMPCIPMVKKGDSVVIGQKIGDCKDNNDSSVHSSVCGEVLSIEMAPNPDGNKALSVIIKTIESDETVEFSPTKNPSQNDLIELIKNSGIVEHYGLPTQSVLNPDGKKINTVLINSTSSEWIGGKFSTPEEYGTQMLEALKLLMKAAGAAKGAIVLRSDDAESIAAFSGIRFEGKQLEVAPLIGSRKIGYYFKDQGSDIVVVSQKRIYGKRILNFFTYNVTGKKVPVGCTPADVGVAICGVKSAKALYDAVYQGKPYYETVISLGGLAHCPPQVLVRIGTPFKDVIEACGGYPSESGKLIANGMRTGVAQYTDEVPVTKTTTRISFLKPEDILRDEAIACTHCAACVDVCPVELIPSKLAVLADQGRFDECRKIHIENCIECGKCAVVCPSKIHILQLIRFAKDAIEMAYEDIPAKESSNLQLNCTCGGE